ncbi:hypothetical protein TSUD_408090 [Trifolium subterraneum]|uniref:LSM domain-containing protein n=1 Tax=Trifolium subterraneum TaxID=3900 RepID=A0A2Z6PFX6_TRISU|nr:hypothetical protein TSUD_408090 [Trifolium subterraneum]
MKVYCFWYRPMAHEAGPNVQLSQECEGMMCRSLEYHGSFLCDLDNHALSVRNCFIRGSVVRYVQLPTDGVDIDLLHDATRREARGG